METKAEQYYPTYKAEHRDVILVEFEEAQRIANGQEKFYGQITNVLLAVATFIFTFLLDPESKATNAIWKLFLEYSLSFSIVMYLVGAILLRYFVDLQKQITINARKVVTLRTLLGLDYGHIHLTLPNWRVEGATNPFVIKYFNGWLNFNTIPFWIMLVSINALWLLTTRNREPLELFTMRFDWLLGNVFILLTYLWIFRKNLNDRHETVYLNMVKIGCRILRIKLLDNFEYIIYRAKLSYLELDRLKVNYEKLEKTLVDVEDREFYTHKGVSCKAIIRGFLSRFKYFRNKYGYTQHGGSTIAMQLSRSLFIPSNQNKYLRKVGEILLSFWLYSQFSRREVLKLYIASVRYEKKVLGLANSLKYFFDDLRDKELSNEEAFFLVERLSNVTSTIKWSRIEYLIRRCTLLIDEEKLKQIYETQIVAQRLKVAS